MRIVSFLCGISSLALVAGCSTDRQAEYASTPVYGGQVISSGPYGATMVVPGMPKSQIEADRDLENTLRDQLNRYGDLATTTPDVRIYAQNGSVTLSGNVPSQRERDMIESLVRNQPGVVAVNDQLQVGYSPTGVVNAPARVYTTPPDYVVGSAPAIVYSGNGTLNLTVQASTVADRVLGQRIVDRLRSDPALTPLASNISISVSDGRVYLRGTVDSEEEHLSIISRVQHTYGVNAVYDQLTVR
ncbi:MAG TPA: BON domain-containing protein [Verrucomicrobiae bacterium]|nr:BON domain-containing protein [Verrucomicrobiae bacterium]